MVAQRYKTVKRDRFPPVLIQMRYFLDGQFVPKVDGELPARWGAKIHRRLVRKVDCFLNHDCRFDNTLFEMSDNVWGFIRQLLSAKQ